MIQPAVDVPPMRFQERYRNNAAGMMKVAVGYTLPGHLAEFMLVTEEVIAGECLLPVPDSNLPFFAAALCEPISVRRIGAGPSPAHSTGFAACTAPPATRTPAWRRDHDCWRGADGAHAC